MEAHMQRERIVNIIFACLDTLNQERESHEQIKLSEDTELLSDNSDLDSLAFVSFSTDLEERLYTIESIDLMLAGSALNVENNPFRSVRTLADYISARFSGT